MNIYFNTDEVIKKVKIVKTKRIKTIGIGGIIITLVLLALLLTGRTIGGEELFYWILSLSNLPYAFMHFFVWIRTKNPVYLITFPYYLFIGLTFLPPLHKANVHFIFAVLAALFMIPFVITLIKKKINWRYREVLELAAKPVEGTEDGFTNRTFPAGKISSDEEQIREYSKFLFSEMIVYPIIEKTRTILVIPNNMWKWIFYFSKDYTSNTHVIFEYSGEVLVKIAEDDYKVYKDELTFDLLCSSMAELFMRWFRLFTEKKGKDIISEINMI